MKRLVAIVFAVILAPVAAYLPAAADPAEPPASATFTAPFSEPAASFQSHDDGTPLTEAHAHARGDEAGHVLLETRTMSLNPAGAVRIAPVGRATADGTVIFRLPEFTSRTGSVRASAIFAGKVGSQASALLGDSGAQIEVFASWGLKAVGCVVAHTSPLLPLPPIPPPPNCQPSAHMLTQSSSATLQGSQTSGANGRFEVGFGGGSLSLAGCTPRTEEITIAVRARAFSNGAASAGSQAALTLSSITISEAPCARTPTPRPSPVPAPL